MGYRTVDVIPIPERTTPPLTIGPLKDEAGAVVPGSALFTCKLQLFNRGTEVVVNLRADVDVKALVTELGMFVWVPTQDDMAVLVPAERQEWRIIRLDYTWAGGTRAWRHEHHFCIANLGLLS